jgi:hypothetical protein
MDLPGNPPGVGPASGLEITGRLTVRGQLNGILAKSEGYNHLFIVSDLAREPLKIFA